jgi:hypothetical protein
MRAAAIGLAAILLLIPCCRTARAEETEVLFNLVHEALLKDGSSGAAAQVEATRAVSQIASSEKMAIREDLTLSGTVWAEADTLPSQSPLDTPPCKIDLQSRILEAEARWEILPGSLVLDLGKKVIHPSSGFFRAPLNLIARPPIGGVSPQSDAAVGTWEEGWLGADLTWLVGDFSFANFFSPRLTWSADADKELSYLSLQQDQYQDLVRVGLHLGEADLRALALVASEGPGGSDPAFHVKLGAGLDTNLGDSLTLRVEVAAADSSDRVTVVDPTALRIAAQTLAWVPCALGGFTWTGPDDLTVMAEYYYDGLGFAGDEYNRLLAYAGDRLSAGSTTSDLLDQLGSFNAGRHYGFARVEKTLESRVSAGAWCQVNLQDLSGICGASLDLTRDAWAISGSITNAWGGAGTEGGLSPLLWETELETKLFL